MSIDYKIIPTGQYDRLYVLNNTTNTRKEPKFAVYVLPADEMVSVLSVYSAPLNGNAVLVYGQPDNIYSGLAWLHTGKWCEDLDKVAVQIIKEAEQKKLAEEEVLEKRKREEAERIIALLGTYQ